MKKAIFAGALLALSLYACKDDPPPSTPADYPDFANLKVGNYWVYERYRLDTNGLYTPLGVFDSTFVEKDTVINGETYFKYMDDQFGTQPGFEATFLRDSLHYLVNSGGRVVFSSENFVDTFFQRYLTLELSHNNLDTLCFLFQKMTDDNVSATVPAGIFVTKNAQEVYLMEAPYDDGGQVRTVQKRYAEDVGIVEETLPFFISTPWYDVRRLVRYGTN
jgi:hypothetical protein